MRIAAIYDIHGNLPALDTVLREIDQEQPDRIVVGGDVADLQPERDVSVARHDLAHRVEFAVDVTQSADQHL